MKMLTNSKTVLITGDFNLCFMGSGNNRMTKGLVDEGGFQQLMREPTHVLGGHIDHVYWRDVSHHWKAPVLERYSPYYSDHDALCVTLIKEVDFNFSVVYYLNDRFISDQ